MTSFELSCDSLINLVIGRLSDVAGQEDDIRLAVVEARIEHSRKSGVRIHAKKRHTPLCKQVCIRDLQNSDHRRWFNSVVRAIDQPSVTTMCCSTVAPCDRHAERYSDRKRLICAFSSRCRISSFG